MRFSIWDTLIFLEGYFNIFGGNFMLLEVAGQHGSESAVTRSSHFWKCRRLDLLHAEQAAPI